MRLRIRDLREDRDLTQKEIADYLLCDQSLYSKYERVSNKLSVSFASQAPKKKQRKTATAKKNDLRIIYRLS